MAGGIWGNMLSCQDTSASARRTLNSLKGQVISCQSQVIELQQRMLDKKSDELDAVTVAVTTTVKESVKSECRGYAESVKKSCNPVVSPQTLTDKVKQLLKEKYRSRNLIVIGLEEERRGRDNLGKDWLFSGNHGPKTEAFRLGKFCRRRHLPDR